MRKETYEKKIEGVRNKMTKGNIWDKQKKSIDFIGEKIKENRLLNQYGNKMTHKLNRGVALECGAMSNVCNCRKSWRKYS